jgi:hypothetical protein
LREEAGERAEALGDDLAGAGNSEELAAGEDEVGGVAGLGEPEGAFAGFDEEAGLVPVPGVELILAEDDFAFPIAVTGCAMAELQSCLHGGTYRCAGSGTDADGPKVDQYS